MTFLDLLKRLKVETGVTGNEPSTVVGQTKEMGRLVSWLAQSWVELQEEHPDFEFLRKPVTFNTVAGQQVYAVGVGLDIPLADFGQWRNESFRSYLQSSGIGTEIILTQDYSYANFRDFFMLGTRRLIQARPLQFAIAPDKSIALGYIPNDVYVVSGEYYRTPQELVTDTDVPIMPSRYHMAIVYKAMTKYGLYESAQEQIMAGREGYNKLLSRLSIDYLPIIQMGGSLI